MEREREELKPGYRRLLEAGEMEARAGRLEALLERCHVCPRECGARRLEGGIGPCFGGRRAAVASWCDHHGEEPPISGQRGSGTIFLAGCNLRCVYCQNWQISQRFERAAEQELDDEALAGVMLELERRGCHNINFVSPTHFAPQLAAAIAAAARRGLGLPIVYNTNGYDSVELLRGLEGFVDIYLPDLKYADPETGRQYSRVRDYPAHARAALAEMWRQVGPLRLDERGIARRGMIVRHLVLPNGLADSEESLAWLKETCGTEVTLSLMAQYYPAHLVAKQPERWALLGRGVTAREYSRVVERAQRLGFTDLLIQDEALAPEFYRPDFEKEHPFEG